jgi:hypothetical protein
MSARYTVELRSIMDNPESSEKLSRALSTYPLYAQKNKDIPTIIPERSELNQRLLNHYKYREIGFETVGRFLDELEIAMNEIMPRYNELYATVEIMAELDNPFDNVDFIEEYKETRNGTATSESNTSSSNEGTSTTSNDSRSTTNSTDTSTINASVDNTSKHVHSATPQGNILSINGKNIDSVPYADDVSWDKSNNSDTSTTNGNSSGSTSSESEQTATSTNTLTADSSGTQTTNDTVEHTFTKKGNQGVNTYAHDMIEFRTSIIDVTNQIINDERISELFMRVF